MMTKMEKEAYETPAAIVKQWQENAATIKAICKRVADKNPNYVMTIARGSSDHACQFAKYLFEIELGLVTASAAPSTVTLYHSNLQLKNALVIGISQSGKSPDICEVMQLAKKAGAITIAIVNVVDSPLAKIADFVLPLHVGEEKAVAATKSYIGSLAALIQLIAHLNNNQSLLNAMSELPDALEASANADWQPAIELLRETNDALVLARGFGFPIALEAALKLKEITSMHAEAFSGAEVLHGPFAVIKKDFPVLLFAQNDASLNSIVEIADRINKIGGKTLLAAPKDCIKTSLKTLPLPRSVHPICDPLMCIQAFYPMAAKLAVLRGKDPDAPDNLQKVTETR